MEQNQIKNWILNYIKKKKKIKIDEEVNFIEKKIFDSLDLMNLILDKKQKKDALAYLPKFNSELMKIAKTGIIKKRNASRNISRITKKISSL